MRSRHVTEGRLILLAMIVLLMVTVVGSRKALSTEDDWLGAMTRAVVGEQAKEGALWGTYAPYVAQLTVVRDHLLKDDTDGVYGAMNRLMDMFERRENGIPPEVADRLFDYCYLVTPAKYHDVSRHLEKLIVHRFTESIGLLSRYKRGDKEPV